MKRNSSGNKGQTPVIVWIVLMVSALINAVTQGADSLLKEGGVESVVVLAALLLFTGNMLTSLLRTMFPALGTRKWGEARKEKYGKLPHFGDEMNNDKVMEIIKKSNFITYETRSGKQLDTVKISDDGKWVCILGGYLPLDLICGYNAKRNVILAIDGTAIKLPAKARLPRKSRDLDAFFKDRGIYYKSLPKNADDSYYDARHTIGLNIDRENFGRVRYLWEKSIVNEKNDYWVTDENNQDCRLGQGIDINDQIYELVLSDSNIAEIADKVRDCRVSLSHYLNFGDYSNEFSICNGVELLEVLGYPANAAGIDFLFDCLGDVDEAYFMPAVDTLHQYPRQILIAKIEERAKLAYENYDVVGLAGLLYLAKDIDYEIEYCEKMKEAELGLLCI